MSSFSYSGFHLPLDIILDTRMGTIAGLDPELANELATTDYRNRMSDDFGRIPREAFKQAYKLRNKETLQRSVVTAMMPVIRDILRSASIHGDTNKPSPEVPKLYINLHPYKFDAEEESELGLILTNLIDIEGMQIELIDMSPEQLTPQFCKDHFNFMVFYSDYSEWMDLHRYELFKKLYTHIVVFAPALIDNDLPTEEVVLENVKATGLHPLEMTEQAGKELVDLTFIDVKYFSITNFAEQHTTPATEATGA